MLKAFGLFAAILLVMAGNALASPPAPQADPVPAQEEGLSYADDLIGTVISPPREIEDFTVETTLEEDFTFSDYGGQLILVYFGYMTCPEVCPTTMSDMLRAYREVGEPAEQVKVLFITLDPERDTLERMQIYVRAFHEDFIGLRTDDPDLLAEMQHNFGVISERREVPDSALGYTIDHSATVFMVAPDGRIVSQYPYGVPYTEIAHDLQVMLDYTVVAGDSTTSDSEQAATDQSSREFRIVIPEGTNDQIMMGNDPGIIPLKIEMVIGQQDILVLENHDHADFLVGGIWVAPYETVSKQFFEPQSFVGLCTITVGRDLIEIIVYEEGTILSVDEE